MAAAPSPVLAERLTAQLLAGPPAASVVDVVERLLAVQAQDPRGARLAIRARTNGLTASDVDAALNERRLVVSTLNRGTLHLVRREDYWWLHPLTTPQLAVGSARRLRQEQVSPAEAERGVEVIERVLEHEGPQSRDQLRERLAVAGVRTEGQAFIHLVLAATLRGRVVRGPMVGNEQAFVLARDWLGKPPRPLSRETALGELTRRYLAGHGPAAAADLAKWAGIPLGDARRGLAGVAGELVDRPDGLASLRRTRRVSATPPPRLLGPFEPSLLGWVSREQITGSHRDLVTTNGIFRAFAMVEGRAAALWKLTRDGVELDPFRRLSRAVSTALAADADDVRRFLGRA
jgi:hypothetical protein